MSSKQIITIFSIFLSLAFISQGNSQQTNNSEAEVRYISDDLFTFLHAGPGRQFRILGSVVAGSRVTLIQEDTENNFIEVIDDKQRKGWVDGQFINTQRSIRALVPGLQEQFKEASETVLQQRNDNGLLNQQIAELSAKNKELSRELKKLQTENSAISEELSDQDQTAKMQWFTRGGIVAVISLLLGIILTYLPKKRRRNDNWM